MAEYFLYTRCEDIDPPKEPIIPPKQPSGGSLPDDGQEGQVLTWGPNGPEWAAGGGSGVTLYNETGQSTTGGMTQKAITDNLNLKANQTALTQLVTTVEGKVDKVEGKGLSTNDYTNEDKAIVDGVTSALASKADASALNNYYTKTEADNLLGDKQDVLTAGDNITITTDAQTGETVISATGGGSGDDTFVAEYGVTTSQELLAYLDSTKEPFAPILVKRGNSYYTAVISSPGSDRVNLSTFGTISGEGYLFNYTVTGANWTSSNIGFQTKLVSGTNIKTINNQSLLGSGNIDIQGGGEVFIANITIAEADLTRDGDTWSTETLTCDKTLEEIYAAATSGSEVFLRVKVGDNPEDFIFRPSFTVDDSGIKGISASCVTSTTGGVYRLHTVIMTDEVWESYVSVAVASTQDLESFIQSLIGDITQLKTTDKSNVVAAINELADKESLYEEIPVKFTGTNGEVVNLRVLGRRWSVFGLEAGCYDDNWNLVQALTVVNADPNTHPKEFNDPNTVYVVDNGTNKSVVRINVPYRQQKYNVVFPKVITRVGSYTFMESPGVQAVKGVVLPDSVTEFASYAPFGYGSWTQGIYIDNNEYLTDIWYAGNADTSIVASTCPNATIHTS